MGSRFMHIVVADHVATELEIRDRGRMLLGALAPDAAFDKRSAHFKGDLHPYAYNSPIDYGRFVVKYWARLADPFFLGYLTHLVMDDIWTMKSDFSGFEPRVKEDPGLYAIYHGDLRLCNAKLDEIYRPRGAYQSLLEANDAPSLDEVDPQRLLDCKLEALADFEYPDEDKSQPLQLFSLEEMVHYVERSKSKALDICRMIYPFVPR